MKIVEKKKRQSSCLLWNEIHGLEDDDAGHEEGDLKGRGWALQSPNLHHKEYSTLQNSDYWCFSKLLSYINQPPLPPPCDLCDLCDFHQRQLIDVTGHIPRTKSNFHCKHVTWVCRELLIFMLATVLGLFARGRLMRWADGEHRKSELVVGKRSLTCWL